MSDESNYYDSVTDTYVEGKVVHMKLYKQTFKVEKLLAIPFYRWRVKYRVYACKSYSSWEEVEETEDVNDIEDIIRGYMMFHPNNETRLKKVGTYVSDYYNQVYEAKN